MNEVTPGGSPIHQIRPRLSSPPGTVLCPVCKKIETTKRRRSRRFTAEGLAAHMEAKHG